MTRKIKKETGLTPGELIKNYRLEKASVLLKEKSGNISEVAYAVGFNSLSYFSHSFKEHYDLTPSNYLKGSQDP
jgi:AraC-like DNA-binding protein